jgi:hypothetical protein
MTNAQPNYPQDASPLVDPALEEIHQRLGLIEAQLAVIRAHIEGILKALTHEPGPTKDRS